MPRSIRSLAACLLVICALAAVDACRGSGRAEHDTLAVDTPASWDEPTVFGFADAAFSLLVRDAEIGLGRARRTGVRQLATRMQRDYRMLAARTDSLSGRRSVVPVSATRFEFVEQHRASTGDLGNEDRRPFDDRYLDHVVTSHQRIMDRMFEALSAAHDEPVRGLLEDAQQRLEAHLGEAMRLKNLGARPGSARRGS